VFLQITAHNRVKICYNTRQTFQDLRSTQRFGFGEM